MRRNRPSEGPRKISITYILMAALSAVFIYMIISMSQNIHTLYDQVDRSLNKNEISYTQAIALKKGEPAIVLMKNNPFRETGRWLYVSPRHPLSNDFKPLDLEELTVSQGQSDEPMRVAHIVNAALKKMFAAAEKDGVSLIISSAYRSDKQQRALYQEYVQEYDAETAQRYVADPGESEHATGLAVDINTYSEDCVVSIDYCAITLAATNWLKTNAPRYGFILRYPAGKEAVTGVAGESWHYRYVGEDAETLTKSNLTLDELVQKVAPKLLRSR